jgi:putative hydrolase of the HAD superfamily
LGIDGQDLAGLIANRYRDIRDEAQCLFEGAIETLESLRSGGARLALLTNGGASAQRAKVERFRLASYFDHISIEGEFGYGKPEERVYRHALSVLNCSPSDAWMAGDNLEWDVAAPMRLGIWGIWVDRHDTGLPAEPPVKPDRIVRAISELA